jgi:hypothetical protein
MVQATDQLIAQKSAMAMIWAILTAMETTLLTTMVAQTLAQSEKVTHAHMLLLLVIQAHALKLAETHITGLFTTSKIQTLAMMATLSPVMVAAQLALLNSVTHAQLLA